MKGIINFCKITYHDYVLVALPNGGLKLTIDCVYTPHIWKIKEMAERRGYTADTTDYGEIVIYSDDGWGDFAEKYQSNYVDIKQTKKGDMIIKDSQGKELEYDEVVDLMDDDIREYLHHQLAPCSPQYFFNEYCKMHKEIYGDDFEDYFY